MKKALIGVGIGCGALVLMGVIAMVAGGVWLSSKATDFVAGAEAIQEQQEQFGALNGRFPFTPPAEGELLELRQDRLDRWIRVSEQSRTLATELEEVTSKTAEKAENASAAEAFSAVAAHTKKVMLAVQDARAKLLTHLEQAEMSPAEYVALTQAVISTGATAYVEEAREGVDQMRSAMEETRKELEAKLADPETSDEERQAMQAVLAQLGNGDVGMDEQLPTGRQAEILAANVKLLEGFKDQIEEHQQTAVLLMTVALPGASDQN